MLKGLPEVKPRFIEVGGDVTLARLYLAWQGAAGCFALEPLRHVQMRGRSIWVSPELYHLAWSRGS